MIKASFQGKLSLPATGWEIKSTLTLGLFMFFIMRNFFLVSRYRSC